MLRCMVIEMRSLMRRYNKIIIPGMVSRMSGKLEEESGMSIEVGPRDSAALPKFLKEWKAD